MYVDIRLPQSGEIITIIISDDVRMRYTDIADMLRSVATDLEKQDPDKDSTKGENTLETNQVKTESSDEQSSNQTSGSEVGQPETGSISSKSDSTV